MTERMNKILIIDDSTFAIRVLTDILKDCYEIVSTRNAEKGIILAKKEQPDLVLLDIEMPGLDGFQVLKMLKDDEETNLIPVIFLTGVMDPEYEEKGFLYGAIDYITKPYNRNVVKVRVKTHISLSQYRKQIEKELNLDTLTEIYNRRGLEEYMKRISEKACEEQFKVNCLMFDIDYFKMINDTYGHLKGDYVLQQVAQILNSCIVQAGGFVSRYGGEEFVAILPRKEEAEVRAVVEQIFSKIRTKSIPNRKSEVSPYLTISGGGVAGYLERKEEILEMLEMADARLYESKKGGRNRFTMYENK